MTPKADKTTEPDLREMARQIKIRGVVMLNRIDRIRGLADDLGLDENHLDFRDRLNELSKCPLCGIRAAWRREADGTMECAHCGDTWEESA